MLAFRHSRHDHEAVRLTSKVRKNAKTAALGSMNVESTPSLSLAPNKDPSLTSAKLSVSLATS